MQLLKPVHVPLNAYHLSIGLYLLRSRSWNFPILLLWPDRAISITLFGSSVEPFSLIDRKVSSVLTCIVTVNFMNILIPQKETTSKNQTLCISLKDFPKSKTEKWEKHLSNLKKERLRAWQHAAGDFIYGRLAQVFN